MFQPLLLLLHRLLQLLQLQLLQTISVGDGVMRKMQLNLGACVDPTDRPSSGEAVPAEAAEIRGDEVRGDESYLLEHLLQYKTSSRPLTWSPTVFD